MSNEPDALREIRPCNVCESERCQSLYEWPAGFYPHDEYETASWDGRQLLPLTIVKCSDCGFVYTAPSFKMEELGCVYPDDIVPAELSARELFASQKWDSLIAELKQRLPAGSTVCDMGARYGVLVKQLADVGFRSFGVDYNGEAVERAKEFGVGEMYQGTITDLPAIVKEIGLSNVNAIVMDDVLEHLVDPYTDLLSFAKVQKPGDLIFSRQMDLDSLGHKAFRKNWYYLQPGAHMSFFSEKSARAVFDKAGYDVVSITRTKLLKQWMLLLRKPLRRLKAMLGRGPSWKVNGKTMYLQDRGMLSDMFLVVARKR